MYGETMKKYVELIRNLVPNANVKFEYTFNGEFERVWIWVHSEGECAFGFGKDLPEAFLNAANDCVYKKIAKEELK